MTDAKHYRYLEFRFDQGRLDRSDDVAVVSVDEEGRLMGDGEYLARGEHPHYLTTRPSLDCDCNDFAWGPDRLCKHLIAALRSEGDEILEACIASARPTPTVILVSGPPGAGKNYYVGKRAKAGDIVWDYDAISSAITFQPKGKGRSVSKSALVRVVRDAFMRKVKDMVEDGSLQDNIWIIWTMPSAKARGRLALTLGAKVIVIEAPVTDCLSRGRTDRDVQSWWSAYTKRDGDIVVQSGD